MQTSLLNPEKPNPNTAIKFGVANSLLVELLTERLPYGKILLLSTATTFLNKGLAITNTLKQNGNKVISIILNDYSLNVDTASGLFCVPEDVRAVVALDDCLMPCANYFASIKNVYSFLVIYNSLPSRIFFDRIPIKNGNIIDVFNISCDRTYIFDTEMNNSTEFNKSAKAYLAGLTVKMIDMLIMERAMGYHVDSDLIDLADKFVLSSAYNFDKVQAITEYIKIEQKLKSAQSGMSVDEVAVYLYNGKFHADEKIKLIVCYKILSRYYNALSCENTLNIPDYTGRTAVINSLTGYDEKVILKTFNEQVKQFSCIKLESIKKTNTCVEKALNVIKKLVIKTPKEQDIDKERIRLSVIHAGDLPVSVNGMTAIRELGF